MQIRCGGEPDADEVVRREPVALQDGGEQLTDLLVHVPGLVPFQLDGSPDGSYRHLALLLGVDSAAAVPRLLRSA
ncbi:hypothetical protein SCWH03_33750 [Streptomyces pacificus]|uniref:Uncharacterized protein n=1 Tax=Streptomyces pacificus TaxID=2705029 RepID=A0A6A0AXU5_9ACTN|nr:hypothetical protein SCWH03_33750 [Streptomyces pacificus]